MERVLDGSARVLLDAAVDASKSQICPGIHENVCSCVPTSDWAVTTIKGSSGAGSDLRCMDGTDLLTRILTCALKPVAYI